jgi:hypothetical protein
MKKSILLVAIVAIVSGLSLWQMPIPDMQANKAQIPSVSVHSPVNPGDLPMTYEIKSTANQQLSSNASIELPFTELETPGTALYKAEFIGAERTHHHVETADLKRRYYLEVGAGKSLMQWPR